MSTYNCAIRTNYFRVKDEDAFLQFMERVYTGSEKTVKVFSKTCNDNVKLFAFGCLHDIAGVKNAKDDEDPENNESSYDEFISGLQDCVTDDDAIILYQSGHEKLCSVSAYAEIITARDYQFMNLFNLADQKAASMLNNSSWKTQRVY